MNRIKQLRKSKNLSQKELADILFVNQTAVSQWERNATTPNPTLLLKLCDLFDVTTDYLLGRDEVNPKKGVKIPVLGRVAAGIPIEAIEEILDYEEISPDMAKVGEYFALSIHGDSMEPRMADGDVVIVRRQDDANSGDTVIAYVNGYDATCKKLKKRSDGLLLIPSNPAHEPMFYSNNEVDSLPVRILGKVVELRAKF